MTIEDVAKKLLFAPAVEEHEEEKSNEECEIYTREDFEDDEYDDDYEEEEEFYEIPDDAQGSVYEMRDKIERIIDLLGHSYSEDDVGDIVTKINEAWDDLDTLESWVAGYEY